MSLRNVRFSSIYFFSIFDSILLSMKLTNKIFSINLKQKKNLILSITVLLTIHRIEEFLLPSSSIDGGV